MRIKVMGKVLQKTDPCKMNYNYGIYTMVLKRVDKLVSDKYSKKCKCIRLFTFSNVHIHNDEKGHRAHFYLSGEACLIDSFINSIKEDSIIEIDDITIMVDNVSHLPELPVKDKYLFKTKVVINIPKDNKTALLEDIEQVEERLVLNAVKKANILGRDGDIRIKMHDPVKRVSKYRQGHIFSWDCQLEVTGDYAVVNTIYECGAGENTASGHGLMWEVKN